jgi:hypothetical protein
MDDKLRNMLSLIKRSKVDGDGWYKVSKQIWPLLAVVPDDLIERRATDDGGFIKLTPRGHAVADYL